MWSNTCLMSAGERKCEGEQAECCGQAGAASLGVTVAAAEQNIRLVLICGTLEVGRPSVL